MVVSDTHVQYVLSPLIASTTAGNVMPRTARSHYCPIIDARQRFKGGESQPGLSRFQENNCRNSVFRHNS